MPKKLTTNSKAEAARERIANVKAAAQEAAAKAAEDAKWTDQGSTAAEKRKREKAAREAEEARKRAEKKALAAQEEASLASVDRKAKVSNAEKMTRVQLLRQAEAAEAARQMEQERQRLEVMKIIPQPELTQNVNRLREEDQQANIAQYGAGNVIDASGIDAAIGSVKGGALTSSSSSSSASADIDRHPEKRLKSAYAEYEERMLPIVKEDNPRLKLSQYKEQIFKMWQKAPENPINIRKAALEAQSLLGQTDAIKYAH